jgi:lipopolysaccharide transport system permease protein
MNYFIEGFKEFQRAFSMRDAWLYLGLQDIKLRYRRSVLGPWWLTISTAIMVIALGFLWSKIFLTDLKSYMPFFAVGYVFWTFILMQLTDSITGFVQFENIIKQTKLPFPIFVFRLAVRNFIVLLHNFVVVLAVLFIVGDGLNWNALILIPAFILIYLLAITTSIIVSIFCTRFRDLQQVVLSGLQIVFFFSPILWQPSSLKGSLQLISFNPVYHCLEIIRQPLLGFVPSLNNWLWVIGILGLSFLISIYLLGRYRSRIVFWL